ncbi:MAG: hypothetical protein H7Y17_11405 [Chlorobia bacterium]|nr:hypothetical protein [Fimbriimonadaceae bacterium]
MVDTPQEFQSELKQIGRLKYHRYRRVAAILHYYKIDAFTIEERLVERGCSREFAQWIVESASSDTNLARRIEDAETPESIAQVLLKGLNGVVTLVIVFLVAHYIQLADQVGLMFVFGPILLIASLIGSLMTLRALSELRRRWSDKS